MTTIYKPDQLSFSHSPEKTTRLVLRGTLIATAALGALLVLYNGFVHSIWLESSTWVIVLIFTYLFGAELLLKRKRQQTVNWMLVAFYLFIAFATLVLWGLNAPVGILTISFVVILPGLLMGAYAILPVALLSIATLLTVQALYTFGKISPNLSALSLPPTFWDVSTYSTILLIFALVSWLSGTQRERSLKRALFAEEELKKQKNALSVELKRESATLRIVQLNEIRQLHKFALLGQSTAATMHDLSNLLSVLNLDIDDLDQQTSNSQAIQNARESIEQINGMVRQARYQLTSYDQNERFDAIQTISQCLTDLEERFNTKNVKLKQQIMAKPKTFSIIGNPLALMQITTILINNALDACKDCSNPEVLISIRNKGNALLLSVHDNGTGVEPSLKRQLFSPMVSSKSTGLGVGLYIAQYLAKHHFNGNIKLEPSKQGATFTLKITRS